jgi:hypothetical protein
MRKQQGRDIYVSLYTDSLSPDKAAIVRRIPAPAGYNKFCTDRLSFDKEGEAAQTVIQLRAGKLPGTELWKINRRSEYGEGEGKTVDVDPVMSGLCFFDALYYCAKFQTTEQSLGQKALVHNGKIPHYREAGKKAGQPFDADLGTPVPAVDGEIIGSGRFDGDPDEIAAGSNGIKLLSSDPTAGQAGWLPSVLTGMNGNEIASADENNSPTDTDNRLRDKQAHIKALNNVTEKGNRLLISFFSASRQDFISDKGEFLNLICHTLSTAGIGPLIKARKLGINYVLEDALPVKLVNINLKCFSKAVAKLPDVPEKKACEEFAKVAAYSLHMERAAFLDGKIKCAYFSKGKQRKMISAINKAAAGLHPGDDTAAQGSAARLMRAFAEGKIKRGDNKKILRAIWKRGTRDLSCEGVPEEAEAFLNNQGLDTGLIKSLELRRQKIENPTV